MSAPAIMGSAHANLRLDGPDPSEGRNHPVLRWADPARRPPVRPPHPDGVPPRTLCHWPMLRRSAATAFVVGTILVAFDQGAVSVEGPLWIKCCGRSRSRMWCHSASPPGGAEQHQGLSGPLMPSRLRPEQTPDGTSAHQGSGGRAETCSRICDHTRRIGSASALPRRFSTALMNSSTARTPPPRARPSMNARG